MNSFDLLSVALVKHWRRPDRMYGPDGSERKTDEDPQHVVVRVSDGEVRTAIDRDEQHQGRGDAFGHGVLRLGSLEIRGASLHERLKRYLTLGEVANREHEFRRDSVIGHLADAPSRDAEVVRERFGSAALRFKPGL